MRCVLVCHVNVRSIHRQNTFRWNDLGTSLPRVADEGLAAQQEHVGSRRWQVHQADAEGMVHETDDRPSMPKYMAATHLATLPSPTICPGLTQTVSSKAEEQAQQQCRERERKNGNEIARLKREQEAEIEKLKREQEQVLKDADLERARKRHEKKLAAKEREEQERKKAIRLQAMKSMPVLKRTEQVSNEVQHMIGTLSEANRNGTVRRSRSQHR